MVFPETASVMSEMMANNQFGPGAHTHATVKVGQSGLFMGEIPFDPEIHDVIDVRTGSFMEELTGERHVGLYRQIRPLHLNVVADYSPNGDHTQIGRAKQRAVEGITEGLIDGLTSVTDRLSSYAIGVADSQVLANHEEQLTDESASPEENAEEIANLASRGLTIVVSDFRNVDFSDTNEGDFAETGLALKINHPLERRLPAGAGPLVIRGLVEVNTNKPRELARANTRLQEVHDERVAALQASGLTVASLILRPNMPAGFDYDEADTTLAAGLTTLALK